jgi:beta-mannosidase
MSFRQLLHDGWEFLEPRTKSWLPARVPGCVHTDLRRNGLIPDPFWGANELELQWIEEENWTYRARFTVSQELWQKEEVDLVAEGLDTLATVVLNGRKLATTDNMFVGWRWPVKKRLRPGVNELEIRFESPMPYIRKRAAGKFLWEPNDPVGGRSRIRKEQCSFGWDWGPRFATCGIYKELRLEGWSVNRILSARIEQAHAEGAVTVRIHPELARKARGARFRCRISAGESVVAEGETELIVKDPQLWWPNGMGEQPLYNLEVELLGDTGIAVDTITRRIGLRTIELDRHPDEWGESFQFKVNGVAVFAKGANWVPAHSFVTEVTRATYEDLLTSAVDAHMNMIRVWGGGIYEAKEFYDLCDEKGLLVWQDFMFACSTYPGDRAFLASVKQEAEHQVKRLAGHACLALWCGNNEIEQAPDAISKSGSKAYTTIFYKMLPRIVEEYDGSTSYWPSSPHNPEGGWRKGCRDNTGGGERKGDAHFWDVWHARFPVKRYEEKRFRFCSEFGMQSYASPEVAATFCPPAQMNAFSPAMENHQKNAAGNQIIFDYLSRRYRFPKDYAALSYLSQLNQAYCMRVGVEHFRRIMPRCMGALYWQLNDCWPVASWSSIEFGGRWKALHYEARRFFAPALVSAHVPGDERQGEINRLISTVHEVHLFTVYDGREPQGAELRWMLYHLDGRILREGKKRVSLLYGESVLQESLDFAGEMQEFGAGNLYLRAWLEREGELLSQNTVFLTAPRFMELPRAKTTIAAAAEDVGTFRITFTSPVFQHGFCFHLPRTRYRATDNYFDLFPGVPHTVRVSVEEPIDADDLRNRLTTMSLVDSY